MLEEREIIAAVVAILVLVFFFVNRSKLTTAPNWRVLVVSFGLLAASLICSVVEVLFWQEGFNFLQHALAPASLVLLAIWSWLTCVRSNGMSA